MNIPRAVEASALVSLEDEKKQEQFKKESKAITGHYVLDSKLSSGVRLSYVMAVIDTIGSVKPEFFIKTYPRATRPDIMDAVFKYY